MKNFLLPLSLTQANRQFCFEPKKPYDSVAASFGGSSPNLQFSIWQSILKLVRTHFGGRAGSEKNPKPLG
ncbi:MAG: hypothetical protein HY434_00220 [Candidatus Liptonbacteria bacterium]|nr:hypothetical protein [Candidatus Liptonbacteria bacterium]